MAASSSRRAKNATPDKAVDHDMIRRAIRLAVKGEGRVEPNPMVGCVIVKRGRIIGEGWHRRFGGPHAEIEALTACRESPVGATVYLTLEPCCHFGKTPPCTDALIAARVARVVAAAKDPDPRVAGRGAKTLRKAGIRADLNVLTHEAATLLAPYLTRLRRKRPYVIAKWAQSLDGHLIPPPGRSRWISAPPSLRKVHQLRARVDAVLVGAGTTVKDDPLLTARGVRLKRNALRVVLDSRLRIPEKCRLVTTARETPVAVFTSPRLARSAKARRLAEHGVEIIPAKPAASNLSLNDCLRTLCQRGVTNLLVEGGPTLLSSFLRAGLVDEAWAFVAPDIFGGPTGPDLLTKCRTTRPRNPRRPPLVTTKRSGRDTLYRIRLTDPAALL